jgi:cytidyltransferase-like protein
MGSASKIVDLDDLPGALGARRQEGHKVVLCHGVFDLVHIGHIRHFESAKQYGQILVVTITPDRHVNKGPHRPAFPEQLRAEAIAALDCVDFVAINKWPTAVETLHLLRPDVYAKGAEYRDADKDVTGGIARETEAAEAVGARVAFTDDITFSSSGLLNRFMPVLSEDARAFLADFGTRHSFEEIRGYLERGRRLKVLVVGETIIDEYQYCQAIGKSSKAPAVVAKAESSERFAGGILAVANHLTSVCDEITVISQIGSRDSHEEFLRSQLSERVQPIFLARDDSPTIVKRRFIESYFFTPMFELYEINDESLSPDDDAELCETLRRELRRHDLAVVVDYGHSMITEDAVAILSREARFLVMNAQANAGNRGYHRLSKYPRADYICAAEHEMRLEARDWRGDLRPVLSDVSERLTCPRVMVTCGKRGALCYSPEEGFIEVPALAAKVVDRVGAGDAFLSVTAPLVALGAPMDVVGFVGNVAGAEAVATVGHRRYLQREAFAKHMQTLLV